MKAGISGKLALTYITIIIATVISGSFCLYVLNLDQRTNAEMRFVTLPSLEHLKEEKLLGQEIKKLANKWVFMTNNRDQERLQAIVTTDYPAVKSKLNSEAAHWKEANEKRLFYRISVNNKPIMDSVTDIMERLNKPESFTNDKEVDRAAETYNNLAKVIAANDKLFEELINTKSINLETQQNTVAYLLKSLYFIVLVAFVIVILVSLFSLRFSRRNVVAPLLQLNKVVLDIAKGEVEAINETSRSDEIGEMHNAIGKLINGIIDKINFSEKIGEGNYLTDFNLLSKKDKLGVALLTMRDNLKATNEALIEQGNRLTNAQKLARVGNFQIDLNTGNFQSSPTMDDVLGLDEHFTKSYENVVQLILPAFREDVERKWQKSVAEQTRFTESFMVKRWNDHQERWVTVIGEFKFQDARTDSVIFGTLQDITEGKMLELELNNSYQITTEQNRRLLNFSYIVSHNLRMHAVNIHSLLDLIAESDSEEERQQVFQLLVKASQLLDETMHHLNDVVAMQNPVSVEIEPQILHNHIVHATDVLKTQIANKGAIINNYVDKDFVVNYNPAYLDSIVLNFVSNAIKYSHPDRRPVVNITCYRENPKNPHSRWILEIADNGLGIDMAKNGHKLFGMYKTFHNNKDAKGIGLFMTRYQVEAMGGKIEVESELNKGTTFKIYIK